MLSHSVGLIGAVLRVGRLESLRRGGVSWGGHGGIWQSFKRVVDGGDDGLFKN